ncbi:Myosin-15 [Camellia lanceoleosa]|uniref:Myosin-15 n=1 Tax=Camellia lanceoleosa TaxID=1840588 RepID=A0ACC0GNN0_9ERIC|nr:Myosin-15 [Camellia lanceoleosa]
MLHFCAFHFQISIWEERKVSFLFMLYKLMSVWFIDILVVLFSIGGAEGLQTCLVAFLSRCDVNLLLSTLCTHSIQTREGIIVKALDCNAAVSSWDALAKTIYARLFDWLVEKINRSIGQDKDSQIQLGVLDIYGFECFKNNRYGTLLLEDFYKLELFHYQLLQ